MRTHDNFLNLVTGKLETVERVEGKNVVMTNGCTRTAEQVEHCMRYLGNDTEKPVPDAVLIDGAFSVNGEPVETGTLRIEKILGTAPGCVFLEVKGLEKDKKDLFLFYLGDPNREEHFEKILSYQNDIRLAADEDNLKVFIGRREDEDEDYKINVSEEMLVYYGDQQILKAPNRPYGDLAASFETLDKKIFVFESHEEVSLMTLHEGEAEERVVEASLPTEKARITELIVNVDKEDEDHFLHVDLEYSGTNGPVKGYAPVYGYNESLLIIEEDTVTFTNNGFGKRLIKGAEAVKAVKTHPHLVDFKPGTHTNVFYLADDAMETVKIVVQKTADRGFITKVQ